MRRYDVRVWGLVLALVAGCGSAEDLDERVIVMVRSAAPAGGDALDGLRVTLVDAQGEVRLIESRPLAPGEDPTSEETALELYPAATYPDGRPALAGPVRFQVVGLAGGRAATVAEASADWEGAIVVTVQLETVSESCDDDADGYLDCSTAGCCVVDDDVLSDCDDSAASVWPGASEDPCEACDDVVDQDCDGADVPCVDVDGNGVADCAESSCASGGEGVPESCNGLDDDCDGETDEDWPVLGDPCDGDDPDDCADGVMVCVAGAPACNDDDDVGTEVCDGVDNDCDGETDEDFPEQNQPCDGEADDDLCEDGIRVCVGGDLGCNDSASSSSELCNGLDDDCDGLTDEDYPQVGEACDGGDSDKCKDGVWECNGSGVTCSDPASSSSELCNGLDDDCDGLTDEPWLAQLGSDCGVGACAGGEYECATSGADVVCDTMPASGQLNAGTKDKSELDVCDAVDNDCDGATDENFTPPLGEPCDGPDDDLCLNGTYECNDPGTNVECVETLSDLVEVCDNVDNDCDGSTDEGLTGVIDAGCDDDGACGEAGQTTALCTAGVWACSYNSPNYQEGHEFGLCDDVDNDCDGETDEDFKAGGAVVYTEPDGVTTHTLGSSCGLGGCEGGEVVCDPVFAGQLTCDSLGDISADICNAVDDDCDGSTDEDFLPGGPISYEDPNSDVTGLQLGQGCGFGACDGGEIVCSEGGLECSSEGLASEELCDFIDNDCDGATDEDFKAGGAVVYTEPDGVTTHTLGSSCGLGYCDGGTVVCDPVFAGQLTCSSLGAISTDICNSLDDDCDGETDEHDVCGGPPCGLLGEACPDGFWCVDASTVEGLQYDYCESDDGGSVWVPAGEFFMGCNTANSYEAGVCDSDEKDESGGSHLVDVPSFVIQRTEVSIEDYSACPEAEGCDPSPCDDGAGTPAACMNWAQAKAYCEWLPAVDGQAWRLCTEAEWEKAARGGCETVEAVSGLGCQAGMRVYPWSGPGETFAATCTDAQMWPCAGDSVGVTTMPQGASPYGALDMAGNVSEWVQDCYHGNYTGAPDDGSEWTTGCPSIRVVRGGSFDTAASSVRSAFRDADVASDSTGALGLRCCRSID